MAKTAKHGKGGKHLQGVITPTLLAVSSDAPTVYRVNAGRDPSTAYQKLVARYWDYKRNGASKYALDYIDHCIALLDRELFGNY